MIGVSVLVSLLGLLFVTFLASISSPCSCYCCCCCCCLPLHRLQALHSPSSPSSSEAAWSSPSSPFGFGFFPFVLLLNMRFFPLEMCHVQTQLPVLRLLEHSWHPYFVRLPHGVILAALHADQSEVFCTLAWSLFWFDVTPAVITLFQLGIEDLVWFLYL